MAHNYNQRINVPTSSPGPLNFSNQQFIEDIFGHD